MLVHADCLLYLETLPTASVDSIVTDPPYGLSFMAKGWDTFKGNKEYAAWCEQWARECLRVLKPGGYMLAFGGTRTYHALAWGVESAGFEIRDQISWVYLSGFPKSMDVGKAFDKVAGAERDVLGPSKHHSLGRTVEWGDGNKYGTQEAKGKWITAPTTPLAKQWEGWKTSLKPAHEPIVVARKPFGGTVAANVEQYGTGAINVGGCRIPFADDDDRREATEKNRHGDFNSSNGIRHPTKGIYHGDNRPPVNYDPSKGRFPANCITTDDDQWYSPWFNISPQEVSKKATKADRGRDNRHPTVKPTPLMAWLIRLVTPPGGVVLDPFAGSGSTLVAAQREGFSYIGIEVDRESYETAQMRLLD